MPDIDVLLVLKVMFSVLFPIWLLMSIYYIVKRTFNVTITDVPKMKQTIHRYDHSKTEKYSFPFGSLFYHVDYISEETSSVKFVMKHRVFDFNVLNENDTLTIKINDSFGIIKNIDDYIKFFISEYHHLVDGIDVYGSITKGETIKEIIIDLFAIHEFVINRLHKTILIEKWIFNNRLH